MQVRHIVGLTWGFGLVLAGCGGSTGGAATSGGTGGSTGTPSGGFTLGGNSAASIATTFQVDVSSGKVSVVGSKGTLSGRAKLAPGMFTGNSIGFTSTTLTNLNSVPDGAKVMSVSLVNNSGMTVGVDSAGSQSGLRVIFGGFSNTTGIESQESNTNVSTFAGGSASFADGSLSTARFNQPMAVALGLDGSLYVADYGNSRIRKISGGYVSTLAGKGVSAEKDGAATTAEFEGPFAIATNPVDGSLIVCDFLGNKIRRVTTTGVTTTVAGTGTSGTANGSGSVATFTNPTGVAVDSSGNIYVSEATSNHIRKITLSGSPLSAANYTVTTFAGSGTGALVDGNGASAEFFRPYCLTCDPNGNVYVADDDNNAIRMIDPSANVTTIAGTGVQSDLDGYGNAATFNHPIGIAFLNGTLFVTEGTGDMVREVVPVPGAGVGASGWAVMSLAGQSGVAGDANGAGGSATFNNPRFLAATSSSSLYMADFGNNQIRRVNPSTGTFPVGTPNGGTSTSGDLVVLSNAAGTVASSDLGPAPYISYPGTLSPGQSSQAQPWNFVVPSGVASFQFQVIVEANTSELIPLQSATNAGSPFVDVRTFAGSLTSTGFQDGIASAARFGTGGLGLLALDGNGVLYYADYQNNAIRRIDPNGNVSTIAGTAIAGPGYLDGAGNVAKFDKPAGLAVNSAGTEIFVCDYANDLIRVMELTPGADSTNASDWTVFTIAGTQGSGGSTNGPGTTALIQEPYGIAMSRTGGEVYVVEGFGAGLVRSLTFNGGSRTSAADWNVQTVAGNGTPGYVNGPGASAEFYVPTGVCCDSFGNLYVCDGFNSAIRKIDPSGNVSTFAGANPFASGYQDGSAANALFGEPIGICIDSAGYLYVCDSPNDVIRRISPAGFVTTVAGIAGNSSSANGPGSSACFNYPVGLAVSPSGSLYVSPRGESSIRLIQTVISSAAE